MNPQHAAADPVAAAVTFSNEQVERGCRFDFSMESLHKEVDCALELPIFFRGREGIPTEKQERNEAALCAYVGETLRRHFGGTWGGDFFPSSNADNFYTCFVDFGNYRYWPSHFVSYRLSNWPQEGTFARYLEKVLPKIKQHLSE